MEDKKQGQNATSHTGGNTAAKLPTPIVPQSPSHGILKKSSLKSIPLPADRKSDGKTSGFQSMTEKTAPTTGVKFKPEGVQPQATPVEPVQYSPI